ncbi:aspartic peptidase domain-containing protein [Cercophora samala]|uniref:Aspartic peptidase domain-containing protein n=1 Tax=Cercophora samala TaxID=330535 RepID=A0AA39ZKE8_9PEZI|nr:aspartic peptidase domain-containing protein [Cercophora samala]
MRLPCRSTAVICDILLLLSASTLAAADDAATKPPAAPLWIQPSGEWYGIDGTWSNFMFVIGSPAEIVYLTPSTALSEIWTISSGGCHPVQICINARGGVFNSSLSESWQPLGAWKLGMNHTGMGGNGDYGLETLGFVNTLTSVSTLLDNTLVAAINDTQYYNGFIGLGVTPGKFGSNVSTPFIPQLAQVYGTIPSHSYGYTAGAYYRENGKKGSGTVASLTLGGYDKLRFVPHGNNFALDPITRLPLVRLRGVTAQVTDKDEAPAANWTSTSRTLVSMDDSIEAFIDSSTPYLWLPTEICDRFADALNLTWREDLGLYTFAGGGEQYTRFQNDESLSFTFTLSSFDNTDNFGQPFNVPGVVNITIPSAAFAQLLRYPFRNVIQWGESSIPYFPLKRSTKEVNNNTYIIGRAFMQEAYIITTYDKSMFSLHQALFPESASSNYSLEAIARPPDSPYPAFTGAPAPTGTNNRLGTGQTVGIVFSAFITGSILGLLIWFCCRRKKSKQTPQNAESDEDKREAHVTEEEEPQSPVKKVFSLIIRKKRSRKSEVHEVHNNSTQPVEVGADGEHQVYEMPVPPEPVELDSHDLGDDETDIGVDTTQGMSEYELTQRKLERQMRGPVPTYTPTSTTHMTIPTGIQEKSMQDVSQVAHYRPPDTPSIASSHTYANSDSFPNSLPSPLTPHGDWAGRMFDLPSPMTVAPPPLHLYPHHNNTRATTASDPSSSSYSPVSPLSAQTFAPSSVSMSRSGSNDGVSPTSLTAPSMRLPPPSFQRTPIDNSRVVCLGPLPEHIELPTQRPPPPPTPTTRVFNSDGQPIEGVSPISPTSPLPPPPGRLGGHYRSETNGSSETLGSNFTEEEAGEMMTRHNGTTAPPEPQQPEPQPQPQPQPQRRSRLVQTEQSSSRRPQRISLLQPRQHRGGEGEGEEEEEEDMPNSPQSMERIEGRDGLIHVPQVADKRYSWEEGSG